MRINSKSESMVIGHNSENCPLWVGEDLLSQVEEFKYLGVSFISEGKNGSGYSMYWFRCSEQRAEPEGEAFNLHVCLPSNLHLWSLAVGSERM